MGRPEWFGSEKVRRFQAPVAVGDLLLLSVKTPGTVLGFRYDHYKIREIIREDGKVVAFRAERNDSADPNTIIRLDGFNRDDSYIDVQLDNEGQPEREPGAWSKRSPYVPYVAAGHREDNDPKRVADFLKDLFGRAGQKFEMPGFEDFEIAEQKPTGLRNLAPIKAWVSHPISYAKWLAQNGLQRSSESKFAWARWVLQADEQVDPNSLKSTFRKLALKFHPDRKCENLLTNLSDADRNEAMAAISEAKSLLGAD